MTLPLSEHDRWKLAQQKVTGRDMVQCPAPDCRFVKLDGYKIHPYQCPACGRLLVPAGAQERQREPIANLAGLLAGINGKKKT